MSLFDFLWKKKKPPKNVEAHNVLVLSHYFERVGLIYEGEKDAILEICGEKGKLEKLKSFIPKVPKGTNSVKIGDYPEFLRLMVSALGHLKATPTTALPRLTEIQVRNFGIISLDGIVKEEYFHKVAFVIEDYNNVVKDTELISFLRGSS